MVEVIPIERAEITTGEAPWEWAQARAAKIQRFWKKALAMNPVLFNGPIHMLRDYDIRDGVLRGQTMRGDFASMMYWREEGFPQAGAINAFGSAVVRSVEGHLLFGRMAAHTASAGQVYPFGGSLDDSDVKDGVVDLEGSITRELLEETGLKAEEGERVPGLIAVREGPRLSLAAEFRFAVASGELRQRLEAFLETDADPELESIVIFRRAAFVAHHRMPPYARLLVDHLMKEQAA